jgi:hypothetical protein
MTATILLALRILLGVSLYAFLGWIFWTLWRSLQSQGSLLAARRVPELALLIRDGEHSPRLQRFGQSEINIGRDPACDICIPGETVSARHARMTYHHNQWWLEDLHSTNGTTLNGEAITIPTVIIGEDEISCGNTTIHIQADTEATIDFPTLPIHK